MISVDTTVLTKAGINSAKSLERATGVNYPLALSLIKGTVPDTVRIETLRKISNALGLKPKDLFVINN